MEHYNGDLAGRIISVDADAWTNSDLLKVVGAGEELLNVQFPESCTCSTPDHF
jgi:hypothetical protein